MVQEFAMKIAHDVAMIESSVADLAKSRLRQRIGKDRMDLWFGGDAKWTAIGHNLLGIEVASSFVADCVSKMFRDDLQSVILEAAGPDFGFQITVAPNQGETTASGSSQVGVANSALPPDKTHPSNSNPNVLAAHSLLKQEASEQAATHSVSTERDSNGSEIAGPFRIVRPGGPFNARDDESSLESTPTARRKDSDTAPTAFHVDRLVEIRRENERRWDEFIPGDHNKLAYTAAQMVIERPGQISPLLIHGPSGTGKSHLALALAHKLRMTHRMRRVLVLTAEQFTIEYTESARGGGFANFRRKYRDVEAIVIDDVQFCIGKVGTLVELRNTIDMLLRDKRQIVLVADRGLNELSGLGADLYARLSGGMACSIDPLDTTTRGNVLRRMSSKLGLVLADTTIRVLALQCNGDARVLQGISHRLAAQNRILGRELSEDEAVRCCLDLIRASQPVIRLTDIEKVVCEAFGLEEKMLRAKSKCQSISQPRMLAMFLARKYTRTALSEIGEYFGNRQHSTVISAQKKVEQWLETDGLIGCGRGQVGVRDILKNLEATLQVG